MNSREEKERIRSERSDRKIRVNSPLSKPVHEKLDRLAVACGISKTGLGAFLIKLCLENENIVNYVQDKFKDQSRFRIIPSKNNGELEFIYAEKLYKK
jgi:hypothetical protein